MDVSSKIKLLPYYIGWIRKIALYVTYFYLQNFSEVESSLYKYFVQTELDYCSTVCITLIHNTMVWMFKKKCFALKIRLELFECVLYLHKTNFYQRRTYVDLWRAKQFKEWKNTNDKKTSSSSRRKKKIWQQIARKWKQAKM